MEERFAVIGPGAIGLWLTGLIAESGADVTVVARGRRLDELRDAGKVTLDTPAGVRAVAVQAGAGVPDPDATVLVAVKSRQTADVAALLHGHRGPVVSAQNGLTNLPILVGAGLDAHAMVLEVGCDVSGTTVRQNTDTARVLVGHRALGESLARQGLPCDVVDDIQQAVWRKVMLNAAVNPLTALSRHGVGRVAGQAELRSLAAQVMHEVAAVAAAAGVQGLDVDDVMARVSQLPPDKSSSMLVDLQQGRPLEIEILRGVLDHAAVHHVRAPTLSFLHTLLSGIDGLTVAAQSTPTSPA